MGAFVLAAGATTLMAVGSPASAAPPPASLFCNTASNNPAFQTVYTDTMTFTLSPASVSAGGTVTATYTGATGLTNGSPSALAASSVQVNAVISLSGAMTGDVVATTAPGTYPAAAIASGAPTGAYSATTTFTATGSGTLTGTVRELIFNSQSLDTYCSPAAGNFPAPADPAPTYLAGYTPNYQADTDADATPNEFADAKISGTATTVASADITITAVVPTDTSTPTPTSTGTSTEPPIEIPTGAVGGLGLAVVAGIAALGAYAWTRRPRTVRNHE